MSYFAGLARDRMGAAELEDALASIRALLAFLHAHGPDAIALRDAPMRLLTNWTELPDGSWVRGKMSRFALIVDRDRGTPLAMDIFESPDEGGFDWSPVLKFVLDTFLKLGCVPGRLAVFGMAMNGILKRIVETELKGVDFLADDRCEISHRVFKFLQRP